MVRIDASSQDPTPIGCYGGPINFESSPRRMHVVGGADYCGEPATSELWLVAF